jgi:hypothetical protein
MYSGEHASWDFLHERGYADTYEVYRRFPFWPETVRHRSVARAALCRRAVDGADRRQARGRLQPPRTHFGTYGPDTGAAYPRHAGFYIWAYAHAYAETRDPKYIERAEALIESRTSLRPQPVSLLIEPGAWRPERSADPTLRALLWDAAALVPSRTESWRRLVSELDERAFAEPATETLSASGSTSPKPAPAPADKQPPPAAPQGRRVVTTGGRRTESTTLSPLWNMAYGSAGYSGRALLDYTRYLQTRDVRFLEAVERAADRYLAEGLPRERADLWPRAAGQVISLMTALALEPAIEAGKRRRYLEFAHATADMALEVFPKNGLFRADGSANHYEAITGADDLAYALLQLYAATGIRRGACRTLT